MSKPFVYGKYVILDRIAVGGMAEVFRAKTFGVHGFQRLLVIKRILPHLSKDEEFVDMFIDEAKIAVGLTHANICQVTDLGKIDDNYFIAMEYVSGKDLRAVLKKSYANKDPLDVDQSIFIASEICKGLEYAHKREDPVTGESRSVIHRDISPQNIMISYHGEVKIVDFGIAKTEFKIHRTQAGVLKGKFAYMSPEQSTGHELNNQTDIFSAGIILYEMLTNRRLFLGGTDFETLENIKKCEVPSIRDINPRVSIELEQVVRKALAKEQSDRFQSAAQMQNALSKILYTEFPNFMQENLAKKLSFLFTEEIKKETESLKNSLEAIDTNQMIDVQKATAQESSNTSHPKIREVSKSLKGFHVTAQINRGWMNRLKYPLLFLIIAAMTLFFGKFFFGKKPTTAKKTETKQSSQKNFHFETTPPQSTISLNGEVKGKSPLDLILPLNQQYSLSIEKEGYEPIQQSILTNADSTNFVFELSQNRPVFGAIKIDTSPSGARVYINGQNTNQTTPTMIDELPFGDEVEVLLQRDGYRDSTSKVKIAQTSQDLHIDLKKRGPTLKINPTPATATIYLNDKVVGKTISDLTKNETYDLRVEAKGFETQERKIKIESDQLEFDIELKKRETQIGRLSISATPWATILIDGKVVGTSPILNYSLLAGKHTVIFRHPDFPDVTKTVNIKFNDLQKLIVDLRQESNK